MNLVDRLNRKLNLLQEEFLACAAARDIQSMETINAKIESLEKRLAEVTANGADANADPASDAGADLADDPAPKKMAPTAELVDFGCDSMPDARSLIASLEFCVSDMELQGMPPGSSENLGAASDSDDGGDVDLTSKQKLGNAPDVLLQDNTQDFDAENQSSSETEMYPSSMAAKFGHMTANTENAGRARLSLLKAVNRAKDRENLSSTVSTVFESQVEEAASLKAMIDETGSFLDLFFNPSKFIANQLEKQGKIVTPAVAKTAYVDANVSVRVRKANMANIRFDAAPGSPENVPTEPARTAGALREKLSKYTFYEILSLDESANRADVQIAYEKKLTGLRSRYQNEKSLQDWQLNEFAEALTRAHAVLSDARRRKDYDLSLLGLHDFNWPSIAAKPAGINVDEESATLTCLGLLQACQIVSAKELAAAASICKGEEKAITNYLIDKQLISFEEVTACLLALDLISKGRLSLGQFKICMQELRHNSVRFVDTLVAEGWLSIEEIQHF